MSLKSLLHSSFRRCCRVTIACVHVVPPRMAYGGDDLHGSARWTVSTAWLCSLVSAVDQT